MPVSDDQLYVEKDELACLRREYLDKCWIRFQDPGHQFEDLNEEYLQNLQVLLGNDEEKIAELQQLIKSKSKFHPTSETGFFCLLLYIIFFF